LTLLIIISTSLSILFYIYITISLYIMAMHVLYDLATFYSIYYESIIIYSISILPSISITLPSIIFHYPLISNSLIASINLAIFSRSSTKNHYFAHLLILTSFDFLSSHIRISLFANIDYNDSLFNDYILMKFMA